MPVAGEHAHHPVSVESAVELLAPGKVIDEQDRSVGRLRREIGIEPVIDGAGDPRKGFDIAARVESLPLPRLAVVDDQVKRAYVGTVVKRSQRLLVGIGFNTTVVVVIARRRVDGDG